MGSQGLNPLRSQLGCINHGDPENLMYPSPSDFGLPKLLCSKHLYQSLFYGQEGGRNICRLSLRLYPNEPYAIFYAR